MHGHQCACASECTCVCVCVQTQLWLALRLITRYSQLLITRHLFCPRSTLFCAYYQPGSGRRVRGRALSNTLLPKFSLSAVFSLALCCRGHLCMHLLETEDPANSQTFESLLIPLISLLGWSLFTQPDDIMTIKGGISSIPLPVWRLPGVCFGIVWHADLHLLSDSLEFAGLWHPLHQASVSRPWLNVSMRSWWVEWCHLYTFSSDRQSFGSWLHFRKSVSIFYREWFKKKVINE